MSKDRVVKELRKKREASGSLYDTSSSVYSRIIINKTKRYSCLLIGISMYFVIASFIFANLVMGSHWGVIAFPVIMLCLVLVMMPMSEAWDYRPWQKYPQQVERHYFD